MTPPELTIGKMDAGAEVDVDRTVDAESGLKKASGGRLEPSSSNQGEILGTLATVEEDSQAIAESFSSLSGSLRSTLSEVRIKNQFFWVIGDFIRALVCLHVLSSVMI